MMTWTEFKRLDAAPGSTIDINRQYDTQRTNQRGKLIAHEIGWNIRATEPGKGYQYGILHIHWKPKDGSATVNHNISAHFKATHASQRTSGKSNHNEISRPADNVLYNRFTVLNAPYSRHASANRTRPPNAQVGWISLKSARVTQQMVDDFRQLNDQAALADLGRNNLYDLSKWDQDSWYSYVTWMGGG